VSFHNTLTGKTKVSITSKIVNKIVNYQSKEVLKDVSQVHLQNKTEIPWLGGLLSMTTTRRQSYYSKNNVKLLIKRIYCEKIDSLVMRKMCMSYKTY